jgi:hypothetical protein
VTTHPHFTRRFARFTAFLNDLWEFDPAASAWTELTPSGPPSPRRGAGSVPTHFTAIRTFYSGSVRDPGLASGLATVITDSLAWSFIGFVIAPASDSTITDEAIADTSITDVVILDTSVADAVIADVGFPMLQ